MSKQDKAEQVKEDSEPKMEELEIGGAVYTTRLTSKFKNRTQWTPPDRRKVLAVIPGNIQKLMVAEGDEVAEGDSMMILEAMKMRNEIKAPFAAIIKKVNVKEGDQVSKSFLLLEFE
jgi:biotin carboxyl carrier protein